LLGRGVDENGRAYFGIWDSRNPGPAARRYDATDQGWGELWKWARRHDSDFVRFFPGVKCPTCGSETAVQITGTDKFASAMLVGVFALGKMGKSFECAYCHYRW
jgi:hypothetical protein